MSPALAGRFLTTLPPGKSQERGVLTEVPNLFNIRDWFRGRQFFHRQGRGDCSGGNASDGEWQMKLRSHRPLLTSGCVAGFLTGCGLVPVHGLGVGDPWS